MSNTRSTLPCIGSKVILLASVLGLLVATAQPLRAQTYTVLYSFTGTGGDGANPNEGVILDSQGNLYGTTVNGGSHGENKRHQGFGTAFKLTPSGTESIIYNFSGGVDAFPQGLAWDAEGNLFGTTIGIGQPRPKDTRSYNGSVFKLKNGKQEWHEKVLFGFTDANQTSGVTPAPGLVLDAQGNLYGTTERGGDLSCDFGYGCGVVFEVTPSGTETVLHNFTLGSDGIFPSAALVRDAQGNLYGTTELGGNLSCNPPDGCGTVFEVTATGTEKVLYSFAGGSDGAFPYSPLIFDAQGNLYSTTDIGGGSGCGGQGCGTIFQLTPGGKETVLYSFAGGTDGVEPVGGLLFDSQGNLYGTTDLGGSGCTGQGCGTVYQLTPGGKKNVLYNFTGGADGGYPYFGSLVQDAQGNLYGTTYFGGDPNCSCGVVFKLDP